MKAIAILFIFLVCSFTTLAKDVPRLSGPVIDHAKILPSAVKTKLSRSLKDLKRRSGIQLQLFVVDSLDDETLEGYSIKVTDKWKLGKKGEDKGVLFLVAMKERKMRIEVGRGLEGALTDAMSGRIIDLIRPYFKQQKFALGIIVGLSAIASTSGEELRDMPVRRRINRSRSRGGFGFLIIIFVLMLIFGRGGRGGGMMFFFLGMLSGGLGGRGGGGGFSGGGGGSWGGGGGGFSGGGASGGW